MARAEREKAAVQWRRMSDRSPHVRCVTPVVVVTAKVSPRASSFISGRRRKEHEIFLRAQTYRYAFCRRKENNMDVNGGPKKKKKSNKFAHSFPRSKLRNVCAHRHNNIRILYYYICGSSSRSHLNPPPPALPAAVNIREIIIIVILFIAANSAGPALLHCSITRGQ